MGTGGREQIVAGNEAIFREINEAIERGRWPGEDGSSSFRCECAHRGCADLVELTRREYEAVRAHPRRFLVVPGHHEAGLEDLVETHGSYAVVEKRGQAGEVAEASDPRA